MQTIEMDLARLVASGIISLVFGRPAHSALEAASPLVGSVDESLQTIEQRIDLIAEAKNELKELGGT